MGTVEACGAWDGLLAMQLGGGAHGLLDLHSL